MELDQEIVSLYKEYKLYLDCNSKDFLELYNSKKNKKSLWIDFLKLFIKYEKSFSKNYILFILKGVIKNDTFIHEDFFAYLLASFLYYFTDIIENKEELKTIWRINQKSLIDIILSCIILDENDKIDYYPQIMNNTKIINNYYNKYLDLLFNEFINNYLKEKKIDSTFNYIIELFDFISEVGINNNKYKIYIYIKALFLEITPNKIEINLEKNLENYKNKELIIKSINIILNNNGSKLEDYPYLNFIKNISNTDENFKLQFFYFLIEDNLINYFKNNDKIEYFDLNSFLSKTPKPKKEENDLNNNNIMKNITINEKSFEENKEEENKIISVDYKIIESLKKNLSNLTIKDYLMGQYKKYSKNVKGLEYLSNINQNINTEINNYVMENRFPLIYNIFANLIKNISNKKGIYPGENVFGITIINEHEYLYTFHNEEILQNLLFNANKIHKQNYYELLESEASQLNNSKNDNNSYNTFNSDKLYNKSSNNNAFSKLSSKSNQNTIKSSNIKKSKNLNQKYNNNKKKANEEYNMSYFRGSEFENNSNHLFKNMFELRELPNYFFAINPKINNHHKQNDKKQNNKKQNDKTNFKDYNDNLFSIFMESDGAYINMKDEKLSPNLGRNFYPFILHKTFIISEKNNNYKIEYGDEALEIQPKSIIISESKLSIPKDIKNFSFSSEYPKNELDGTLLFTLNKLMKKINFYKQFVENEVIDESEKIGNYKFHLFLIYNNIPINDLEEIINTNLILLDKNKYIKNEFKLQIIYLIPNLGTYNINMLQKDFNLVKQNLKNDYDELNGKYNKITEENRKITEENRKITEENRKITEENRKIIEENRKIIEENSKITEGYWKITEENRKIREENRKIIEKLNDISKDKEKNRNGENQNE